MTLTAALFLSSLASAANAAVKAGAKCSRVGQTTKIGNQIYLCRKDGSRLVWRRSLVTTPPTPRVVNDLLGFITRQDNSGDIWLDPILRQKSDGTIFRKDGVKFTTSFTSTFYPMDIWQNSILACPNPFGCVQTAYISPLNASGSTAISFANISQPGGVATPFLREADFGDTTNTIIARVHFSTTDGLNNVIYRYDVTSKIGTPIFATYCNRTSSASCSTGASIESVRVIHKTATIYFVLDVGNLVSNPTQYVVSLPMNSPAVPLRTMQDANTIGKVFETGTPLAYLYRESDPALVLSNINPSPLGNYVYFKTSDSKQADQNNGLCRLDISTYQSQCNQIAPADFISDTYPIDDNSIAFSRVNMGSNLIAFYLYSFDTGKSDAIQNTDRSTWLMDLSQ